MLCGNGPIKVYIPKYISISIYIYLRAIAVIRMIKFKRNYVRSNRFKFFCQVRLFKFFLKISGNMSKFLMDMVDDVVTIQINLAAEEC